MSISSACHWITPLKGFQFSLEYRPGSYYMAIYPAQKDSPTSSFISLDIMFGSRQTLLECSRKSAKREQEAIVLFDQKVEEFISSHPVEETEVLTISPGDRFLLKGETILVIMPASESSYHCQTDGEDRVVSYSSLIKLERIEPLSPDELRAIADSLTAKWEQEKRQKEEEKKKKEETIAKGKAIVPSWAESLLIAELTEDRSDYMSDLFRPHVVVEGYPLCFSRSDRNNTQEMKNAANLMDETKPLSWGEYDQSDRALRAKNNYGGGWQIRKISFSSQYESTYAYKLLGEKELPQNTQEAHEEEVAGATIRRNEEHDGIEVIFDTKPSSETIEYLKSLGFRWSRRQNLWYAKYTEERLSAVTAFLA